MEEVHNFMVMAPYSIIDYVTKLSPKRKVYSFSTEVDNLMVKFCSQTSFNRQAYWHG